MEFGTLELQIFVSLVVVLGTAFVALVCDFLKGNNEQLRERNIELRVRQDERERLGLHQPLAWLQGIANLARSPQLAESLATAGAGLSKGVGTERVPEGLEVTQRVEVAEPEAPVRGGRGRQWESRHGQDRATTWASKEELEELAGRAARIRARHESAQESLVSELAEESERETPGVLAESEQQPETSIPASPVVDFQPVAETVADPAASLVEKTAETVEPDAIASPAAELEPEMIPAVPEADLVIAEAEPVIAEAEAEPVIAEAEREPIIPEPVIRVVSLRAEAANELEPAKILPIDISGAEQFEPREELDLTAEINRLVADREMPIVEVEADAAVQQQALADMEMDSVSEPMQAARVATWIKQAMDAAIPDSSSLEMRTVQVPAASEEAEVMESIATPTIGAMGLAPAMEPAFEPEPPEVLAIPAGLHDAGVCSTLLENPAPFNGVAVAIGINDYESVKEKLATGQKDEFQSSLNRMIQSLLQSQDFASQFMEDEFILLFPGESGSSAQRRLFQVSEKLWDFQLRSLGQLSIIFSWGGMEVHGESLVEAVTNARERMYQTKRNRKSPVSISMRKVVNG